MIDLHKNLLGKKFRKNIGVGVWILLESIFTGVYYSDVNWIYEFKESFQWTRWEELEIRRILKYNVKLKLMILIKNWQF